MTVRVCQNSFSKGVISPSLEGRVDLEQYNLGLKKLVNGIVLQEGCVINRSGLEFITKTKTNGKTRLIPFVFNSSQSYIIEVGEKYFRFIKDSGYILDENNEIYELSNPYLENELFELDYTQQLDIITLVHKNHPPMELSRIKHNQWELNEINFKSKIEPPSNINISYTGSLSSNITTYNYVICSVDKTTNEESVSSNIISVNGHLEAYWTTSEYITLTWQKVENAVEYNIYRDVNGIFGYVGTSSTTSFKDNNIEPDLKSCAPKFVNPFEKENPSCVCYYQQRKLYASSKNLPQTLWASQTGTNNNFNISRPLNSTDSITLTMCDNGANEINHILPFRNLIVLTNNSEWKIAGSDGTFSATPTPSATIQSCYGSSKIKPVVSGSMVLFVQSGGNIVRDLGYNYLSDSYDGEELTIFASHLFDGNKVIDMSYSKEPYQILWCVMEDGSLNALTYNPKQKIAAWHTHKTKGKFESVCSIRENDKDNIYFVVKRTIDNNEVKYIEKISFNSISSLKNAFYLDCALCQEFDKEIQELKGLDHLKNEEVNVLADFGVIENLKVDENGNLKLPYPAKNVVVGLGYSFKLETLNFENEQSFGLKKTINKVEVKILNSREDFYIQNDDESLYLNSRDIKSIDEPEKLFSKIVEFYPLSYPDTQKSVKIIQNHPLPLKILSITTTLSLEE